MRTPPFTYGKILGALCGFLFVVPLLAGAATDYLLVDDLPFIGKTTDIASYLKGIFRLGLGLAVTLSIFMLVLNGIRYMISDITGEKAKARSGMKDAIIGLLIVFGSVLILNTINPRLTEFALTDSIKRTVAAIKRGQAAMPRPPAGGPTGGAWPSDANERERLENAGINVKKPPCTHIGQVGCTSVAGMSGSVVAWLINLRGPQGCNCTFTISGGTEYWLHDTHDRTGSVLDVRRPNPALDAYIRGKDPTPTTTCLGNLYSFGGSEYLQEGNHWHMCLGQACRFAAGCKQ